jgi:hypothetical protein
MYKKYKDEQLFDSGLAASVEFQSLEARVLQIVRATSPQKCVCLVNFSLAVASERQKASSLA